MIYLCAAGPSAPLWLVLKRFSLCIKYEWTNGLDIPIQLWCTYKGAAQRCAIDCLHHHLIPIHILLLAGDCQLETDNRNVWYVACLSLIIPIEAFEMPNKIRSIFRRQLFESTFIVGGDRDGGGGNDDDDDDELTVFFFVRQLENMIPWIMQSHDICYGRDWGVNGVHAARCMLAAGMRHTTI